MPKYIELNKFATTASEKVKQNEDNIIALDNALENFNPEINGKNIDISENPSITSLNDEVALKENIADHNSDIQKLQADKQNKLKQGKNISMVDNPDGTTTISAAGGAGGSGGNVYMGDLSTNYTLTSSDYVVDENDNATIDFKNAGIQDNTVIQGLDDKIDINNNLIKQKENIADHNADMKQASNDILANTKEIIRLDGLSEDYGKEITKNQTDIATLNSTIETLNGKISDMQSQINLLVGQIANKGNVQIGDGTKLSTLDDKIFQTNDQNVVNIKTFEADFTPDDGSAAINGQIIVKPE